MNRSKRVKRGEADLRNPIVEIDFKMQYSIFTLLDGGEGESRDRGAFLVIIITK